MPGLKRGVITEPMRYEFCTLFDKNYLLKGLALYESLSRHATDFRLWVLCMDDEVFSVLHALSLEKMCLISLGDFEDDEMRAIRPSRTSGEYCWTCTPSLPLYLLDQHPELELITYLDADLFFYSDPSPIFEEFADASIGMVEHRYSHDAQEMSEKYGTYNVECMMFRNDERGREALTWWRDRCIEWCFARIEDGKWADQKYLEDWPERFSGVRILRHKGIGLAPWNIRQHVIISADGGVHVDEVPLVFYHFHQFSFFDDGESYRPAWSAWGLTQTHLDAIYRPYAEAHRRMLAVVRAVDPEWNHGLEQRPPGVRARDMVSAVVPVLPAAQRLRGSRK